MSEKLKSNECAIYFACTDDGRKECVCYVEGAPMEGCKYLEGCYCCSKVANVNAMTVLLKLETVFMKASEKQ